MKIFLILILVLTTIFPAFAQNNSFSWQGENFLLNGKPFMIRSGEMHYPRVPRDYWRDRFRKAKALGLNTITTYIFWNLHEPKPGQFDFSGNLDIAEYVREAKEEGLYVIVRPGPYICTEWEFGGIPAWLLAEKDMKVRTADSRFLDYAKRYMAEVGKRLAPMEIAKGGNVIMVQVENEYGSFGNDMDYMNAVKKMVQAAGFTGQLFTSDGSGENQLKGGTLPDVLSVINFGVDSKDSDKDAENEFKNFAKFRQNVPKMVGEYWVGWFDHWGKPHHTVDPKQAALGLDWMLKNRISFNLYMFHGGTTFGFMNGANYNKNEPLQPDTSSYDYDSPLDESGKPTEKYYAIRELIQKYFPDEKLPAIPQSKDLIEVPQFQLNETADLFSLLGNPKQSEKPLSMEETGQNYGFILYRTKITKEANGELKFDNLNDYGHIFVDGNLVGKIDRRLKENSLKINVKSGSTLEILVENGGRLNFGREFIFDRKGIVGNVTLNSETLNTWQIFNLPLDNLKNLKFKKGSAKPNTPTFYRGFFQLQNLGDTYLDTTNWGKGFVWVNGHNLGRHWKIGPQQTLFVPSAWFKKGKNEVIVLDTDAPKQMTLRGIKKQIFAN
ncbi:MAG: beta-galactosidase [Pyrinomonadaceae bacterium]|nr:beta-galactosidase [Pyrinomonadaceae bacterium]